MIASYEKKIKLIDYPFKRYGAPNIRHILTPSVLF